MRTATINTPERQKEKFEENYRIEEIGEPFTGYGQGE